ncbi:hypothetical protein STSP2_01924 [Anaerohalosphaera lusitana]|uniref:Uncharacterized protein n=1 Tax=Anaerohalosphaera lusitana TaxID=1936003 RepID=A0A1U9NLD4_9BACT|nr:hypothetical protein [Anaerohalosphaera lusitana]AQT68752.1 hypothetical protein STSP2_01924 [Anaerohalosphaera lusitana]
MDQEQKKIVPKPGECIPWEVKRQEYPKIVGDEEVLKKTWQEVDQLAYTYVWHVLLSF